MSLIFLCCFAFVAGLIEAMAGGGGLIQLPAFFLLMPQLSLVQTLASNKTASFFGTIISAVRYSKKAKINLRQFLPALLSAFVGGFSGALLVSFVRKEQFMPFIACILLLVLIYTIFKKELGLHRQDKNLSPKKFFILSLLTGGIIGFYDGLIGPGTGSFFIFAFVVLFGNNFLYASAHAKIINCVTNISALAFFLVKGNIVWHIALFVAVANMLGNYIGAHIALKKGSRFIRAFFIVMVSILILKLLWDYLR